MKKLFSLIVTSMIVSGIFTASTITASDSHFPFKDVPTDAWYYEDVERSYNDGIMQGKSEDSFDPAASMTRAEIVTVLCRLSGEDSSGMGASLSFDDTTVDSWYADCVAWGVDAGIVKGLPGNRFAPNNPATRQEIAVFIDRLVGRMGITLYENQNTPEFNDYYEISDFAEFAVEVMRYHGIMNGDENGNFNPTENISRAEISAVVVRYLDAVEYHKQKLEESKIIVAERDFLYGSDDAVLPYRLYLPDDYSEDEEYPLLVYLHYNGKQGTDNERHLDLMYLFFENRESPVYNSIILAPQCPSNCWWSGAQTDKVVELIDYINSNYSTDMSRQYITGVSMGGDGTWDILCRYPEKVSAALPVAGGTAIPTPDNADELYKEMLEIPVMIIHDRDDEFFYPEYGTDLYGALTELGATNLVFRETSGFGHGIYGNFISKKDISALEWLFAQERQTN